MLVVAHKKGFFEQERQVGDEFDFPESALKRDAKGAVVFPSWFAPAAIAMPIIAKAKAKEDAKHRGKAAKDPSTLSELGKQNVGDLA